MTLTREESHEPWQHVLRQLCLRGGPLCRERRADRHTEHPHAGFIDVYAAIIPDFPFKPGLHVHYQETVMYSKDRLPKLKDIPKEVGGPGEALPE